MRHKYDTPALVLGRTSLGEANSLVTVLTPSLGLVRARAQGLRKSGAKLASALTTFAESELVLVRGKEGWRVAGAVLQENWSKKITTYSARARAARVSGLVVRLVADGASDLALFPIMNGFFEALATLPKEQHEAAELLAVLRVLRALGLDAGEIPGELVDFMPEVLASVAENRSRYVARINTGIAASGL